MPAVEKSCLEITEKYSISRRSLLKDLDFDENFSPSTFAPSPGAEMTTDEEDFVQTTVMTSSPLSWPGYGLGGCLAQGDFLVAWQYPGLMEHGQNIGLEGDVAALRFEQLYRAQPSAFWGTWSSTAVRSQVPQTLFGALGDAETWFCQLSLLKDLCQDFVFLILSLYPNICI